MYSVYSAVSSAVQSTKVLRELIQTTEKWVWKFFSALCADGSPLHTSTHCLRQWPYHSKNASYGPVQVPLQPSCAYSWLKPHPLSNKLAIVTALDQWSSLQINQIASPSEMEALHGQKTIFLACSSKGGEKWATQCWPRDFLQLSPEAAMLTGPSVKPAHLPAPFAGAEPKSQGHCWKWHHKLKVV